MLDARRSADIRTTFPPILPNPELAPPELPRGCAKGLDYGSEGGGDAIAPCLGAKFVTQANM